MSSSAAEKAFLLLTDGTLFEGKAFGFRGEAIGEVVFNTGITGYQEVLTDPSYFGQLVLFTYPELGNTGVNPYDQEALHPSVKGLIVREFSQNPSNWRSKQSLESWLQEEGVVGISGLDTRALVKHLRSHGAMNGVISTNGTSSLVELLEKLRFSRCMEGLDLVKEVTTREPYMWNSTCEVGFDRRLKSREGSPYRVVAVDFGIKRSILERLVSHGCEVKVVPANSDISLVHDFSPEGVFFSNGPGDPSAVSEGIDLAKKLIKGVDLPMFGICLGHQILGLAIGGRTFKLAYGHRGLNHPCGKNGQIEITSQNHGFALDPKSLPREIVDVTHFNLNDKTVAGIAFVNRPIFGVQYHPEASPGPHDADHHFARFVSLMEQRRKSVV